MAENDTADANIIVNRDANWVEQETNVLEKVESALNGEKLDALICVAGGWAGGNAEKGITGTDQIHRTVNVNSMLILDLAKNADLMWKQSVWTSKVSGQCGILLFFGEFYLLSLSKAWNDTENILCTDWTLNRSLYCLAYTRNLFFV